MVRGREREKERERGELGEEIVRGKWTETEWER